MGIDLLIGFILTYIVIAFWKGGEWLGSKTKGSGNNGSTIAMHLNVDVPYGFEADCKHDLMESKYTLWVRDKGTSDRYFFVTNTKEEAETKAKECLDKITKKTEIFPNGDYTRNMHRFDKDGNMISKGIILKINTHGAKGQKWLDSALVCEDPPRYGMMLKKLDGETISLYADTMPELQAKADPYYYEIIEAQED